MSDKPIYTGTQLNFEKIIKLYFYLDLKQEE